MTDLTKKTQGYDMFETMEKAYKLACIMAKSDLIPEHYRNKPENTFIAVQTAYRMNMDPMLVMQNTYVVQGKLGMSTAFAISLANNSGLFKNGIRYKIEGKGQDLKVTAYTNLKTNDELIEYTITMMEAAADGWTRNSKYRTLPELMLRYRAATLLIRTHAPEVLNGMQMVEEIEDTTETSKGSKTLSLLEKMNQADAAYENPYKEEVVEPKQIEAQDTPSPMEHPQQYLMNLVEEHQIDKSHTDKWLNKAGVKTFNELSYDQSLNCIQWIQQNYEK